MSRTTQYTFMSRRTTRPVWYFVMIRIKSIEIAITSRSFSLSFFREYTMGSTTLFWMRWLPLRLAHTRLMISFR